MKDVDLMFRPMLLNFAKIKSAVPEGAPFTTMCLNGMLLTLMGC